MWDRLLVRPRVDEVEASAFGDDIVPDADVVMDRAFDLPAPPATVWPWFAQLGKGRSGWYVPRWIDVVIPPGRRALRHLDPALVALRVGSIIPDWGGHDATFEVVRHDPPHVLVHTSDRGHLRLSWAILLEADEDGTRVHLRLRIGGIRRWRLVVAHVGGLFDLLTISALAAGLRERVARDAT